LYFGADLTSGTNTPQVLGDHNIKEDGNVLSLPLPTIDPDTSKNEPVNTSAATSVNPAETNQGSLPVEESQPKVGTSETRYEQQVGTHATGQLDRDMPDAIDHEHGGMTATVEPITVDQAPKDVRANLSEPEEPPKPGFVERAKEVVDQTYEVAANTTNTVANRLTGAVSIGQEREEGAGR
jgi:hypothetical protein